MNNALAQIITVFTALITVAIVAVIVSKNANTAEVIKETFSGFGNALQAATSPVTGGGLSMPSL